MKQRRGLRRSIHLFRAFLVEQPDPDRFYSALAEDSVASVAEQVDLTDKLVLDVGAGPRQFALAFRERGARYVPLDHDTSVASVKDGGIGASALAIPVADRSADVVFSSNLLEHVPNPAAAGDELVRVTKPGGLLYICYTNWLSPWGGHEASPWHWFGSDYAIRRYQKKHGKLPKNRVGETMFKVTVAEGLRWARSHPDLEIIAVRPRYYPDVARHLLRVPGLREIVTWNLLMILRRRPSSGD